jgi:hypothetical protein
MRENLEMIKLNNHNKARDNPEIIRESLLKDMYAGFCSPISINVALRIPDAMICPLGVVDQQTLQADRSRKQKMRLTHD